MPFVNFNEKLQLKVWNGIHGTIHHSDHLSFGHITLEKDAVLPEHNHIHEQWTHVIEGELEFTLDGETQIMKPGMSVHIPSDVPHSARAITLCKVIDAFLPVREDFKSLVPWTID